MNQTYLAFTLVELMIVVAIIAILAGIAIPSFASMQYRAKLAEVPVNADGAFVAFRGWQAESPTPWPVGDTYLKPRDPPDKGLFPWASGTGFDEIGWEPDGLVRGSYSLQPQGAQTAWTGCLSGGNAQLDCPYSSDPHYFCAGGIADVDGDGKVNAYVVTPVGVEFPLVAGCY